MSIYDHKELMKFFREPDYVDGCAFGLPIHMRRNHAKAWCGYVGIPRGHPFFGLSFSDRVPVNRGTILVKDQSPMALFIEAFHKEDGHVALDILLDCPGGVTWGANHVPLGGGLPGYWYLGFDCSHYNDLSPKDMVQGLIEDMSWRSGTYRDYDFTLAACRKLAEQLMEHSK